MRYLAALAALITLSMPLTAQSAESSIYAPFVSRLDAIVNGSEVVLSWQDSPNADNLTYVILRHSREISSSSISEAEILARVAPGIMSYTDKPDPEGIWWYAVTSLRDDQEVNVIIPWRNSLGAPVSFADDDEPVLLSTSSGESATATSAESPSAMRTAPLPVLRINTSPIDGSELEVIDGTMPERKAVEPEVDSALFSILGPGAASPWQYPDPVVLETEAASSEEPLQAALNGIVSESFATGNWESAEAALFDLAARNGMDRNVRARVQFYLGQCYYFTGRYNESFMAFLAASDSYYPESREWIVRIYDDILPVG